MSRHAVSRRAGARVLAGVLCAAALIAWPDAASAAITLAGTSSNSSEGTTVTVARPAGTAAGDTMILTVVATRTAAFTQPSGWTSIRNTTNSSSMRMQTWRRTAAAGDPSSFTISLGSTARSTSAAIATYANVDTTTPVDASGAATGGSGTATAGTITTSQVSSMLIVPIGFSVTGGSASTPTSTTLRWTEASADTALVMGDQVRPTAGATGARTSTSSPANDGWAAHAIALQEQPTLTADFSAVGALAWGSLAIGTNLSAQQTFSVVSNLPWGVKLSTDGADGRMTEWNGTAYLSRKLASPLEWRLSSLNGVAQSTSFAAASPTQALVTSTRPASASSQSVGVTYRQSVSYADDAALGTHTYRKVITYQAAQGF
jgi:hypothetical protein